MALLQVHPDWEQRLRTLGLHTVEDFLNLPGVIVSGHPDRHVCRVEIPASGLAARLNEGRLTFFLKKEHHISLTQRWHSWWHGHGAVSLSLREFAILRQLEAAGIAAPLPLAAGEVNGRAFLLLQAIEPAEELRRFLQDLPPESPRRRLVAVALGQYLARLHAAGFDHPDLYTKHVLIGSDPFRIVLLDWQRSQHRDSVPWSDRLRDLAALDATLADELVSPRERLRCLDAYLRCWGTIAPPSVTIPKLRDAVGCLRRQTLVLLRKRRLRELRQPPLAAGTQNLLWLDGEALCMTRQFYAELEGRVPEWLLRASRGDPFATGCTERFVQLPGGRLVLLVCRKEPRSWLPGQRVSSPELAGAATLFRLQRYGVAGPRLLAFGQRRSATARLSFLLTEPPGGVELPAWLAGSPPAKSRVLVLRQAAELLRRLHLAGYQLDDPSMLLVQHSSTGGCTVVLRNPTGLQRWKRWQAATTAEELARLLRQRPRQCSRTEQLRFLLHYLNLPRLTAPARRLLRQVQQYARISRTRSGT